MRRREFLSLVGGTAAWPLTARAQQAGRTPRLGVLMNTFADDKEGQARYGAFLQGLQQLGWTDGRNVRIDIRWGPLNDPDKNRKFAAELVALVPDVILSTTTATYVGAATSDRTIPIVFAMFLDPVGADIVESLARPGGNLTGFMQFEYSLAGKWLELLKQIAPNVDARGGVSRSR